jgi:glycosyltransferase involved in cell wall biosynthesis
MKLASIIPNYNHSLYLPRSIGAMLSQSRLPDELFVIDDGSTDNSVEVVKGLIANEPRAKLIVNECNKGVVYRGNEGLRITDADYVHFASADDQVMPGLYEKSMEMLARYPEAALCCSIDEWEEPLGGYKWHVGQRMGTKPCYLSPEDLIKLAKNDNMQISSPTCIIRRKTLIEAGGFVPDHAWNCDWFTYHAAAFKHGICFIPEVLSKFALNPKSFSSNMKDHSKQKGVFLSILQRLERLPYFQDAVKRTGMLAELGGVLDLLVTSYWDYITWKFIRKRVRTQFLRFGRDHSPRFIGRAYLRLFKQFRPVMNQDYWGSQTEFDNEFAVWFRNVHYQYQGAPRDAMKAAFSAGIDAAAREVARKRS